MSHILIVFLFGRFNSANNPSESNIVQEDEKDVTDVDALDKNLDDIGLPSQYRTFLCTIPTYYSAEGVQKIGTDRSDQIISLNDKHFDILK